jgi:NAD-specific glutamate dehydrogenase
LLIYSHSQYLLKRPSEELIEWLQAFLDFLRCREEEVKVSTFRPKDSRSSFLLINTPDVPYLVDSLKNILQQLPQRATILSHPILTIQRDDGCLMVLTEKDNEGEHESFMLVQLEGERDLDTTAIEDEIRDVLQVAQSVGRQRRQLREKLKGLLPLSEDQNQENFIQWLLSDNFVCFGHAAVEVSGSKSGSRETRFVETPVGWLPQSLFTRKKGARKALQLTAEAKKLFARKSTLVVEVLEEKSPLYQKDNLVYFGFRECSKSRKKTKTSSRLR